MKKLQLLVLALAAAAIATADTARLSGPVLGYVFDSRTRAVRPVNGMPGAAHLGAAVALPFAVSAAAFAPGSEFGVVISDSGEAFLLRDPAAGAVRPLGGALAGADGIALNARGSAVLLYASEARRLHVVQGLPEAPSFGPILDVSAVPGPIAAVVLTRDASFVLLAAPGGLWGVEVGPDREGAPRLIARFGAPSAMALVNGDQDLVVADAELNQVSYLRKFAQVAEPFALAGERDGVSGPAGLAVSADGRRLYLVNAGTRSLDVFDLATMRAEERFWLDWPPTRLARIHGDSVFLLNEVGSDPLLLFDTVGPPGVYFVPAAQER